MEKIFVVADADRASADAPEMQEKVMKILDQVQDPVALARISAVSFEYGFPGAAEDVSIDDAFFTAADYAVVRLGEVGGCEAKNQLELLRASGKADGDYAEAIDEAMARAEKSCRAQHQH